MALALVSAFLGHLAGAQIQKHEVLYKRVLYQLSYVGLAARILPPPRIRRGLTGVSSAAPNRGVDVRVPYASSRG